MKKQIKRLFSKSKAREMLEDPPSQLQKLHFFDNEENEMPVHADSNVSSRLINENVEFSLLSADQSAR